MATYIEDIQIPRVDAATINTCIKRFGEILGYGTNQEVREFIRCFVDSITLILAEDPIKANKPVTHEIKVNLKAIPALFVKGMGAGTLSTAIHPIFSELLVRRYVLVRNGRHNIKMQKVSNVDRYYKRYNCYWL